MGARIEPGETAAEEFHVQLTPLHVDAVDVGDFKFSAGRGTQTRGDVDNLVVVEVEPRHGVGGFGADGFFLERQCLALAVDLDNSVPLRILDKIGEDRSSRRPGCGPFECFLEGPAVEDVVAENQRHGVRADELAADQERLGQAFRPRLDGVADGNAQPPAVVQEPLEAPMSSGVEIKRMSRMPANMSVDNG